MTDNVNEDNEDNALKWQKFSMVGFTITSCIHPHCRSKVVFNAYEESFWAIYTPIFIIFSFSPDEYDIPVFERISSEKGIGKVVFNDEFDLEKFVNELGEIAVIIMKYTLKERGEQK